MSYEKIKKIRITTDKVFITSCSNNVWPQDYKEWESTRLSLILNEQGREAAEKEILFSYFEGMMQSVVNDRYQRAVKRVQAIEDTYEIWKKCRGDADYRSAFLQRLYDNFRNPPKRQPCCLERPDGFRFRMKTTRAYLFSRAKFKIYRDPIEAAYALKTTGLDESGFKVVIL